MEIAPIVRSPKFAASGKSVVAEKRFEMREIRRWNLEEGFNRIRDLRFLCVCGIY